MRRASALVAALACVACGSVPLAGRGEALGTLDTASLAEVPVCGHEVAVEVDGEGGARWTLEGELLASTPDGVTVATERGVETVPAGSVRSVEVRVLPSLSGWLAGWTAAGSASTISHGYILVGTLPLWLGVGIASAASAEARGSQTSAPFDVERVSQYARFPQGLPPGWPADRDAARPCAGRVAGEVRPGGR